MSVSEHYPIAASVGHHFGWKKEDHQTYVFEIHIPSLYLMGGRFSKPRSEDSQIYYSPFIEAGQKIFENNHGIKIGDEEFPKNEIELFIFDHIEPRFILNHSIPDEHLPYEITN
jgi:hypothetical protein